MKKILVAIDNEKIFNQIVNDKKQCVYERDIVYKEGVLEYISKNDVDVILTKDDLEGSMTKEIFIKQIKLLRPNITIILFVKKIDDIYLNFLYSNNIFNILDIKEENIEEKIIDMIDGKQNETNIKNTHYISDKSNIANTKISIVTKKKVAVFGTSGAGKSYVSSILANIISKRLNIKTLLIDLDVQSSAIDIYNNLNCSKNILMEIVKNVDNYTLTNATFDSNVYTKGNLSFITNNANIYEYQNNLSQKHYNRLLEVAVPKYDVIISDTTANIFFDVTYFNIKTADVIMFVIEPNYISIRQAIKYLDLMVNIWGIDASKIKIIVNKITQNSLTNSQIQAMLSQYKIIMRIQYDKNIENVINGIDNIKIDTLDNYAEIFKVFGFKDKIVNKNQDMKKNRFIYNMFRKEEVV